MPHRCVRCGNIYPDGSEEILKGCSCGSRFFMFVKKGAIDKKEKEKQEQIINLTDEDKKQIENDVLDIIGTDKLEDDTPIILDLESIQIVAPGKFELDLVNLFNKKNPLVYKLEEGKYVIDIAESFAKQEKFKK